MSDFHQAGPFTTLHLLNKTGDTLGGNVLTSTQGIPVFLLLPSLVSEMKGSALPRILDALTSVSYLSKVVVTLGPATESEFRQARDFFGRLPQEIVLIWNSGPRLRSLYRKLDQAGLSAGPDGKGRSVWMAIGYILADATDAVIALHDCDIVTYNRGLLDRLVYPVASPMLRYHFCKGFYARFSDTLHGRVTRLYVTPLLHALASILGTVPLLRYLDAFRYPLAGEFSMTAEMAESLRFPSGWGLEIGVLAEVYRHTSLHRICQSELCDRYDHKHQVLSQNSDHGLVRMASDIAQTFYHLLVEEGIQLTPAFFKTLAPSYLRKARVSVHRYHHEALVNGLSYDLHKELLSTEIFSDILRETGNRFLERTDSGTDIIPDWRQVQAALPTFLHDLHEAVKTDNDA